MNFFEKVIHKITLYLKSPYTFDRLSTANIEICGLCNLNCKMCGFNNTRAKGLMDFNTFKLALGELNKNGKPIIALHQYGEPLLHPDLGKFLNYALKQGFKIHIYTNGTLLDSAKRALIKKYPVDALRISFSPDRKNYEKLWRNASYETTLENLRLFLAESQTWKIKPNLTINLLHERGIDLEKLKQRADKLFGNWPNLSYQFDEMIKLSGNDPALHYHKLPKIGVPCELTYTQTAILHNGDVSPCCNDLNGEIILGNIKTSKLKEIRNNNKSINLRQKINSGDTDRIPICRNCPLCRANDPLITKDLKKLFRLK